MKYSEDVPGSYVPQSHGAVVAAGQDVLAIGRESDRVNVISMTPKFADFLARRNVPQAKRIIVTTGDNTDAIWRKGRRCYSACVPHKRLQCYVLIKVQEPKAVTEASNCSGMADRGKPRMTLPLSTPEALFLKPNRIPE